MGVKFRERKPGEWWVFVNHKGQRKAKKVGSKEAAKQTVKDIEAAIAAKTFNLSPPPGLQTTFGKYAEKWLSGHVEANLKPSTRANYAAQLKRHILPTFERRPIPSITRGEVRDFCLRKMAEGLSAGTVKVLNIIISSVFNNAIEEELTAKNPAEKPGRYIKTPDRRGKVQFLAPTEGAALLEAAREHDPRIHPLIMTALHTGMRQGELIGLQWGDVDWTGKFIEVRRTNWNGHIGTPKNGKTRRVDISEGLSKALADHRKALAAEALRNGRPMPDWTFPSEDGAPIDASNLRKRFFRCLKKAGIRHIAFHATRHSFASALIANGESLAYVREQLGHHSIQLTVDNYGHLIPGANREAVNRLDDLWKARESATPAQPAVAGEPISL